MAKLPSFQFYPGDWLKDTSLRFCQPFARGLWIDLLCLMFDCEERGVLATDGVPWTLDQIAAAIGGDRKATIEGLNELIRNKVMKRLSSGAYYSKRLVEDEELRKKRAASGSRGGMAKAKQKPSKTHGKREAKGYQITEDEDEDEDEDIFRSDTDITPKDISAPTRAQNGAAQELSGSGRRIRQLALVQLCEALKLSPQQSERQRRPIGANLKALEIAGLDEAFQKSEVGQWLGWARELSTDPQVDSPVKAWQSRVSRRLAELGLKHTANGRASR